MLSRNGMNTQAFIHVCVYMCVWGTGRGGGGGGGGKIREGARLHGVFSRARGRG